MRLVHVALVSRSLINAERFFEQILGLQKVKEATLPKDLTQKVFNRPLECRALVYSGSGFAIEVFVTDAVKPPADPLEGSDLDNFLVQLPVLESIWDHMSDTDVPVPTAEAALTDFEAVAA